MKVFRDWKVLAGLAFFAGFSALAEPLQIDYAQSRIEVAVNTTVSPFVGKLERYQAAVECEPNSPMPTKADISFDFKDLKTGIKGRDAHMLKWLQYSVNPRASFHLRSWKTEQPNAIAVGELTIHGMKREIQVPVKVKRDQHHYDIDGAVGLDYRDFGLRQIRRVGLLSVNPHLKVMFHLSGNLESIR